jgi:magnesium-transporting ATPase (P-type)
MDAKLEERALKHFACNRAGSAVDKSLEKFIRDCDYNPETLEARYRNDPSLVRIPFTGLRKRMSTVVRTQDPNGGR